MIALPLRILWQLYPGLLTCLLFWCGTIAFDYYMLRKYVTFGSRTWRMSAMFGAFLNAIVTIANGGYMPVVDGDSSSLWVHAAGHHHLLFLSDRFAFFSIGDFFIIAGLMSAPIFWAWGMTDPKETESYEVIPNECCDPPFCPLRFDNRIQPPFFPSDL